LVARFEHEDEPTVRSAIVQKLGEIGGPAASEGLSAIAAHAPDAVLRREATLWLAALRERELRR
jgi:hypothetical protein